MRLHAVRSPSVPQEDSAEADAIVDYAGLPPLLPDGLYQAGFVRHETAYAFRCPKVFLWFQIIEAGEHFGKEVYRPYPAHVLIGKPRRRGRFKLKPRSDLFLMLCRVLEFKARPDRISPDELKRYVLEIRTRTVTHDYKQREVPKIVQYTVVDDIVRKLTC